MLNNTLAILFTAACAAWFSWDAWMGFTKGVVHAFYVGTVDRTKKPGLFWFYLVTWMVIGVGLWAALIGYALHVLIGHGA